MSKGIYIAIIICVLAASAVGIGYAIGFTSTIEVSDNVLTDETIIITPGEGSSYSGSFNEEVEFHLGTEIINGERVVVYTPCSWYIHDVDGQLCYNLGTINLDVSAPSSINNLTINMRTVNYYTMSQEFKYMVKAELIDHHHLEDFDMDEGSTFVFNSEDAKKIVKNGVKLTLYMEIKTIDYLPASILDGTVFSFTASVE